MWFFWISAGALAAAAALLVTARAASASVRAAEPGDDPAVGVHRRALSEIDDLQARGVLAPGEVEASRAEAGRRLLAAADAIAAPERTGGALSRGLVTGGAALAALLALGGYLWVGRPGSPDQPYARRLASWSDPAGLDRLDPDRLAAVLAAATRRRANDPQAFEYLGRARMAAGDYGAAAQAFGHAGRLAPRNADYPAEAGEALLQGAEGKVGPEAQAAFREALRRDPNNAAARFHLARARIADGDLAGGVADWRALLADLAPADPRRAGLQADIARAEGRAPAEAPSSADPDAEEVAAAARSAPAGGSEQAAFIRSMVASRAAALRAHPDDPAGWALLVRSYGVLGDAAAQAQALNQARIALHGRPDALAQVEAQAGPPAAIGAPHLGPPPAGAR